MVELAVIIVAVICQILATHFWMVVTTIVTNFPWVQRACTKNRHKQREVLLLGLKLYKSDSILSLVFLDLSLTLWLSSVLSSATWGLVVSLSGDSLILMFILVLLLGVGELVDDDVEESCDGLELSTWVLVAGFILKEPTIFYISSNLLG